MRESRLQSTDLRCLYNAGPKAGDPPGDHFLGKGVQIPQDRSPFFTPNKKAGNRYWINWVIPREWKALELLLLLEKALLGLKVKSRTVKFSAITQSMQLFFFSLGNRQKEKSSCLNKELA